MLNLSCICGRVCIAVAKRPDFIHECNCTLCNKAGARRGYFQLSEVSVVGAARGYRRDDKDDPNAEIRFCPTYLLPGLSAETDPVRPPTRKP